MGAQGKHPAALAGAPGRLLRQGRLRTLQRHQNAVASHEATEGAVVDPADVEPEGVEQLGHVHPGGGGEAQIDAGGGALMALHDVSEPVAIGSGLLIGMERRDRHAALHLDQASLAEKNRLHRELRHEHLHAAMRVFDRDLAAHLHGFAAAAHIEVAGPQAQGRGGPQPMAQLQPKQAEAEEEEQNQECGEERQADHPSGYERAERRWGGGPRFESADPAWSLACARPSFSTPTFCCMTPRR